MLSSPEWVAAAMAYVKDVNAVHAIRQETTSAKSTGTDDQPASKRTRVPKKDPKTEAAAK